MSKHPMLRLSESEFQNELTESFRVRGTFTDDYRTFEHPDVITRSMEAYRDVIARIDAQLDAGSPLYNDDPTWAHRARSMKRYYQREVNRLQNIINSRVRKANAGKKEQNRAKFTDWAREIHNLLEEVAIRAENNGADLSDLTLPAHDGTSAPMHVTEWLDIRERKRNAIKKEALNA